MLKDLPLLKGPNNRDCFIIANNEQHIMWLNSPHILYVLYPLVKQVYPEATSIKVVSGPVYDFLLKEKAVIVSSKTL